MKLAGRISLTVIITLIFTVSLCYGQSTAKQIYRVGVDFAAQGKLKEAEEEFRKALKVNPLYQPAKGALRVLNDVAGKKIEDKTAILLFKGESYAVKRKADKAITEYGNAIEINPKYAKTYGLRGVVYFNIQQHDKAFSDFNKAIELNPMDAHRYSTRGYFYMKIGQYNRAISDFSSAIDINPKYVESYGNRGIAYEKLGKYQRAIEDYNQVILLAPYDAQAHILRGKAYFQSGKHEHACNDFQKACELGHCTELNWAKKEGYCQ